MRPERRLKRWNGGAGSAAPNLKSDPPIRNLLRPKNGLDNGVHFKQTGETSGTAFQAMAAHHKPHQSPIDKRYTVGHGKEHSHSEPLERSYKTTGVHLPADLWELLNRVAVERARTRGGWASVSAFLVEMIETNRKALELELGKTVR